MNTENNAMVTRDGDIAEKIQQRPSAAPAVDIYENADELLVLADLPGVEKDQLAINYDKGQLTIEGRRAPLSDGRVLASEQRPLDFRRAFLVPQGIDTDKITADLNQGVLRVHLPKSSSLKPRQIQVKAS